MAQGSSSSWYISEIPLLLLLLDPDVGKAQLALIPGGGAMGFSEDSAP